MWRFEQRTLSTNTLRAKFIFGAKIALNELIRNVLRSNLHTDPKNVVTKVLLPKIVNIVHRTTNSLLEPRLNLWITLWKVSLKGQPDRGWNTRGNMSFKCILFYSNTLPWLYCMVFSQMKRASWVPRVRNINSLPWSHRCHKWYCYTNMYKLKRTNKKVTVNCLVGWYYCYI